MRRSAHEKCCFPCVSTSDPVDNHVPIQQHSSGTSVLDTPTNQDNISDEITRNPYIRPIVSSLLLPNSFASTTTRYLSSHSHLPIIDMSQSSLPGSFDPFATHPFTNNSGLFPESPQPSQYLMPTPSRGGKSSSSHYSAYSYPASHSSSGASTPSSHPSTPLYSPRAQPMGQPIFTPYRRSEASSPDLVLKKKVAYLAGK